VPKLNTSCAIPFRVSPQHFSHHMYTILESFRLPFVRQVLSTVTLSHQHLPLCMYVCMYRYRSWCAPFTTTRYFNENWRDFENPALRFGFHVSDPNIKVLIKC
jgi:hypothetical protein